MITIDELKVYLPQYLSDIEQKKLIDEIRKFTNNPKYPYLFLPKSDVDAFIMQGDSFVKGTFLIPDVKTKTFKNIVPCMILSNTCDISSENLRSIPLNLSYAPIFNLEKYQERLTKEKGQQIADNECTAIRNQQVTSYFYIPSNSGLGYDGFVHFDKVSNSPVPQNHGEIISNRIFSLNQFGFYLFLFKLSIHFTRIREGINRTPTIE